MRRPVQHFNEAFTQEIEPFLFSQAFDDNNDH